MKEETYLDKAKTNLTTALILYKNIDADEGLVNMVGYHLQQAVELALKHLLFINGIEFTKTHRIEELYQLLMENELLAYFKNNWIDEHAEQLTSWEANTRYILNLKLEKRKVDLALPIISEFLNSEYLDLTIEELNG